eukprot:scaffold35091_cov73-Cyclotella_meneghiniana.AAC.1
MQLTLSQLSPVTVQSSIAFAFAPEAIAADSRWPLAIGRMMTGGGRGVAMGPAEQGQPPFGLSSWLDLIQRQFSPLCKKSQPSDHVRKNRFRRIIMNVMHYDPTKAFRMNLLMY